MWLWREQQIVTIEPIEASYPIYKSRMKGSKLQGLLMFGYLNSLVHMLQRTYAQYTCRAEQSLPAASSAQPYPAAYIASMCFSSKVHDKPQKKTGVSCVIKTWSQTISRSLHAISLEQIL